MMADYGYKPGASDYPILTCSAGGCDARARMDRAARSGWANVASPPDDPAPPTCPDCRPRERPRLSDHYDDHTDVNYSLSYFRRVCPHCRIAWSSEERRDRHVETDHSEVSEP